MSGKRDSDYFKKRLKRDHPKVYSDLIAGRYKSVRAAAIAAGLIIPPTRFAALKREWMQASNREKLAFLELGKSKSRSFAGHRTQSTGCPEDGG